MAVIPLASSVSCDKDASFPYDFRVKDHRVASHLMQKRGREFIPLVAQDEWDEKALEMKWRNEAPVSKDGYYGPPPKGLAFMKIAMHYDGPECVYMPLSDGINPMFVGYEGENIPCARAMCIMVHGRPSEPGLVARHLCGHGHRSCVNPFHLAWGSHEQNANDRRLHRTATNVWPCLTMDQAQAIIDDDRMPNVIAIEADVPADIVRLIKAGKRSPKSPWQMPRPRRKAARLAQAEAMKEWHENYW